MINDEFYRVYDPEQAAVVNEKKHIHPMPGILLIPLFLLFGLGTFLLFGQESRVPDQPQTVDDSSRFGIGGGPPVTHTPTPTTAPLPTIEFVPRTPDMENVY